MNDTPWARLPPDWRTQVLSVSSWSSEEVLALVEEWQRCAAPEETRFDPVAFERFVQEQADVVMALLDEGRTFVSFDQFIEKSAYDHQREAVVVALRRAYPQPHGLDNLDSFAVEEAEEEGRRLREMTEADEQCDFCSQHATVAKLRARCVTALQSASLARRERYGLFFRARS